MGIVCNERVVDTPPVIAPSMCATRAVISLKDCMSVSLSHTEEMERDGIC